MTFFSSDNLGMNFNKFLRNRISILYLLFKHWKKEEEMMNHPSPSGWCCLYLDWKEPRVILWWLSLKLVNFKGAPHELWEIDECQSERQHLHIHRQEYVLGNASMVQHDRSYQLQQYLRPLLPQFGLSHLGDQLHGHTSRQQLTICLCSVALASCPGAFLLSQNRWHCETCLVSCEQ